MIFNKPLAKIYFDLETASIEDIYNSITWYTKVISDHGKKRNHDNLVKLCAFHLVQCNTEIDRRLKYFGV